MTTSRLATCLRALSIATVCLAAQINKPHFVAAFLLSRRDKARQMKADPLELSRAMSLYDQTSEYNANETLEIWRSGTRGEDGPEHSTARNRIAGERPGSEEPEGTRSGR